MQLVIVLLVALSDKQTHMIGHLSTSDRPVAEFAIYTINTEDRHPFPQAGFEPGMPTNERPQTHALDRAAIMYLQTIFGKRYEK